MAEIEGKIIWVGANGPGHRSDDTWTDALIPIYDPATTCGVLLAEFSSGCSRDCARMPEPLCGPRYVSFMFRSEYGIQQYLKVMTGRRVAMQIHAPGRLQNRRSSRRRTAIIAKYAMMSLSFRNARMDRSISAAFAFWLVITPSNASFVSAPSTPLANEGLAA